MHSWLPDTTEIMSACDFDWAEQIVGVQASLIFFGPAAKVTESKLLLNCQNSRWYQRFTLGCLFKSPVDPGFSCAKFVS